MKYYQVLSSNTSQVEYFHKLFRMSQKTLDDVKNKCFSDLATLYINKVLPLKDPKIYETYPNWPDDAPSCLNYKSRLQKKKNLRERKSELEQLSSSDSSTLLAEPKLVKRNSRYKGES